MKIISLVSLTFYILMNLIYPMGPSDSLRKKQFQANFKNEAFVVLRSKCNVCHATKKRTDIFTLQNMDSFALDIHKQVFIKQKMPKGRKVKLTKEEKQKLRLWLTALKGSNLSID